MSMESIMKKLTLIKTVCLTSLLSAAAFNASALDNKYIENALVNVCKASITNSTMKFNDTMKEYRLKGKTVADKLVCNGENVIDFAEKYGSYKVADRLMKQRSENVEIIDVAQNSQWHVTFEVE